VQDVSGRTMLVTGGAQGIGFGIARAFARAGARIALADIDEERLAAAGRELAAVTDVGTHVLDVRDRDAFADVVEAVEDRLGPIAVLCNNAGIGGVGMATALTYAEWDRVLGINLGGVVNGVQTVLPRMLARGGPGHIVNVASAAGLFAGGSITYATSKFAVVGLTEALHHDPDLRRHRIGVTVVCPGLVRTQIVDHSIRAAGLDRDSDPRIAAGEEMLQRYGLSPDVVGERVLDGVRQDRLYVHTDRMMAGLIEERTREILAALPPETERDRELVPVLAAGLAAARGTGDGGNVGKTP
jgi:NAD(P)-dependent dehydrogenase (short-subunit alcohol dehydrogenase family)